MVVLLNVTSSIVLSLCFRFRALCVRLVSCRANNRPSYKPHIVISLSKRPVHPPTPCSFCPLAGSPFAPYLTRAKRILELGAGMSGLAGLGVAACSTSALDVVITDGNPGAVGNLKV